MTNMFIKEGGTVSSNGREMEDESVYGSRAVNVLLDSEKGNDIDNIVGSEPYFRIGQDCQSTA